MTIISIFITFAIGFSPGYLFRGRVLEKVSVFSKKDIKAGREAISRRTQKRKARIMERVSTEGRVTNDEVEELLLVSNNTALKYLNELEKEGKLEQRGTTGRGVYYVPKS